MKRDNCSLLEWDECCIHCQTIQGEQMKYTLPLIAYLMIRAVTVEAAAPVLTTLEPRGAQQGGAFTLTLKGESLVQGAEVITTLPGTLSRLSPRQEMPAPDSELPFLVQLKDDAPVGLYPIRVRTEEGLSNILLFSIGRLPEAVEGESLLKELPKKELEKDRNDSLATAQKISIPVTINGTLIGPDQDFYRFSAAAGQRLVFELEARRAGSAIDPVIEVLDATGREIAKNNDAPGLGVDARVEVLFPKAGEYYALIHDAKYSDQVQNFYRLKIGSYPYAQGIFPLGWQREGRTELTFFGGNLKSPIKIMPDLSVPASGNFLPVSLPGGESLPLLFRLGDLPEILEPTEAASDGNQLAGASLYTLPPSTVVNGRISRPGEVDKYRLSVSPGQRWSFEVDAATLGTSQLDAFLSLFDAATNKRLALADLLDQDDPFKQLVKTGNVVAQRLSFTIPKNVKEIILSVEDLLGRGGPNYGYRLLATPQSADFSLEIATPFLNVPVNGTAAFEVNVKRYGYRGAIRLTIPNLPEDIVMGGGNIPSEPVPLSAPRSGFITLTAKPGAKFRSYPLTVWGESVSSEVPIHRQATAPGMLTVIAGVGQKPVKAPWLGSELPVAVAKSVAVNLEVSTRHARVLPGSDLKLLWKLVRPAEMTSPMEVFVRDSYVLKDLDIVLIPKPAGQESLNEGMFLINVGLACPPVTLDLVLDAIPKGRSEESIIERFVTAPVVTLEVVPLYRLKLISEKVQVKPGEKVSLVGNVEREPGFVGIITVRAEGLLENMACPEIVIGQDQTSFRLEFEAGPRAKPGEHEFILTSSAKVPEKKGKQDYIIPDIKARLIVSSESTTAQAEK